MQNLSFIIEKNFFGRSVRVFFKLLIVTAFLGAVSCGEAEKEAQFKKKINHIIVIYMENRSFDNLFRGFPGADTSENNAYHKQSDRSGNFYTYLPPIPAIDEKSRVKRMDERFPALLANEPFLIDRYISREQYMSDLVHRFYQNQWQINNGKNDKYVAYSNAGALTMGYHDMRGSKLWELARKYTLCDRFFQAAYGGSFLNHIWLIAARTPEYKNAPNNLRAQNVENAEKFRDGSLTPDGYAVNTLYPSWPTPLKPGDSHILPPQEMPSIGDRLSDKKISWKWYSEGWNEALKNPDKVAKENGIHFQFHHQPFAFFKSCMKGSRCFNENLADSSDFIKGISTGNLPKVAFFKPAGANNQHPGYSTIDNGDKEIGKIVDGLQQSSLWSDTVVIITYDENGGLWDHVSPPSVDRWGPGTRIPAIIVSPFARKKFVDHTVYDTTSILKFIETRFDLKPLAARDKKANSLLNALQF